MELNTKMVVKVAVLLFLMGFSATVEAGRINPNYIISQLFNNDDASYLNLPSASTTNDCCNGCICTLPWPKFTCVCGDVFESCPASCKTCTCTKSIPPQCHCRDIGQNACPLPVCT